MRFINFKNEMGYFFLFSRLYFQHIWEDTKLSYNLQNYCQKTWLCSYPFYNSPKQCRTALFWKNFAVAIYEKSVRGGQCWAQQWLAALQHRSRTLTLSHIIRIRRRLYSEYERPPQLMDLEWCSHSVCVAQRATHTAPPPRSDTAAARWMVGWKDGWIDGEQQSAARHNTHIVRRLIIVMTRNEDRRNKTRQVDIIRISLRAAVR